MYWPILALLTTLTLLNSVAVIALIRQVGLLHLRVKPVPALEGEGGPSPGDLLSFDAAIRELPGIDAEVERILLGFFSPTCALCAPLLPAFRAIAATQGTEEAVALVTDADRERAEEYLQEKRIDLPLIAETDAFKANQVPGAPFAVVSDAEGRVLASGVVNTLENVELLLERAQGRGHEASSEASLARTGVAEAY